MTALSEEAAVLGDWRRGWPVLLGAVIGMAGGISMFVVISGFFIKPLQAEFGWGRGLISMTSGAVLLASLTMPAIGLLVDRFGARLLLSAGSLAFAACYFGLSRLPPSPTIYLVLMALVGLVAGPATAPLVFVRPILDSFDRARGIALALAMSGTAIASLALLPILQRTIAREGWRAGYLLMVPFVLVCGTLGFLLLSLGARRARLRTSAGAPGLPLGGQTFKQACRDRRFWLLVAAMASANLAAGAFGSQLAPLLSDKGVPGPAIAWLAAASAAIALFTRPLIGFLVDRFWAEGVGTVAFSVAVIGQLMFLSPGPAVTPFFIGIGLIAIAQGGEMNLLAYYTAEYFGLKAFGAIFGVLGLVLGVAVAVGGIAAGFMFDRFGDYRTMLIAGSILSGAAAFCVLANGLPRRPGQRPNSASSASSPEKSKA